MKMVGDDCEPELHLSLGSSSSSQDRSSTESNRISGYSSANSEQQQQQRHQITIFYNGRICVCDVTEFQARAIISLAKREMDDRMKKLDQVQYHQEQHQYQQENRKEPSPPQPQAVLQLLNQGQPMKRSLQRFLQKRKTRINAAASPYNDRHEMLFSQTP